MAFRLRDRMVELGTRESDAYAKLVEWLPTTRSVADLVAAAGMDEGAARRASRLRWSTPGSSTAAPTSRPR